LSCSYRIFHHHANKAKIRAIEKATLAAEAKEAATQDAQEMAQILLIAVTRGKLLKAIPKTESARSSREGISSRVLPQGITYKTSHHAQTIANNQDVMH